MVKQTTPQQAEAFHLAMTGQSYCFPDCCLCKATTELNEIKRQLSDIPGVSLQAKISVLRIWAEPEMERRNEVKREREK